MTESQIKTLDSEAHTESTVHQPTAIDGHLKPDVRRRRLLRQAALIGPGILTLRSGAALAALTCAPIQAENSGTFPADTTSLPTSGGVEADDVCIEFTDNEQCMSSPGGLPRVTANDIDASMPEQVFSCDKITGYETQYICDENRNCTEVQTPVIEQVYTLNDIDCQNPGPYPGTGYYTCQGNAVMSADAFTSVMSLWNPSEKRFF
jgi:hypothetical protein